MKASHYLHQFKSRTRKILRSTHTRPILAIIALGFVFCLPSISSTVTHGHDSTFHFYRHHSTVNALKDGQVLPQVDPHVLGGFGYSWNMFYGPLSTYFSTALRLILPTWPMAINGFIILSVILSGIFLYLFLYRVIGNRLPALFAALIYMAAPYHLLDIYIRQAHGELLPFVFAPILLWGLYNSLYGGKSVVKIAVGAAGIFLSHNISAVLIAFIATVYLLLNIKALVKLPAIRKMLSGGLLAIGLSAFFLLPLIELYGTGHYRVLDSKYSSADMNTDAEAMNLHAISPGRLVFEGVTDSISNSFNMTFSLGLILLISMALIVCFYRSVPVRHRRLFWQSTFLGILSLILTTDIINWNYMPSILSSLQFPWRFLFTATLFLSISAGVIIYYTFIDLLKNDNNKKIGVIAVAALCLISSYGILSSAEYSKRRWSGEYDHSLNSQVARSLSIYQYSPSSLATQAHINTPRPSVLIAQVLRERGSEPLVIEGDAKIIEYTKTGTNVSITLDSSEASTVELPLTYYPGYRATLNTANSAKDVEIDISDNGLVSLRFTDKVQNGRIEVRYGLSAGTAIGIYLSVAAAFMLLLLAFGIEEKVKKYTRKQKTMA